VKKYFKFVLYLSVLIGFSVSNAGSYSDFFAALTFDRAEEVQKLLNKGFDPNSPSEKGVRALIFALQSEAPNSALILAKHHGTQINAQSVHGETALMLAAINNYMAVAKVLIERGAEVNKPGWTPLHYAATRGHRDMMRLLLENDAYIDAEAPNGSTPLMMAARYAQPAAVKLLLEEGADPTLVNTSQESALDLALKADKPQSAMYIRAFTESWFIQNPIVEEPTPAIKR
jgi:ankyrin repeat protein